MKHISQQIHAHLLAAPTIVIVAHQNPDGDTIGSAVALFDWLNNIGKSVKIFCATPLPASLEYLIHSEKISFDPNILHPRHVHTIVVLDSGDLRYAGVEKYLQNHTAIIINIDHHPTNEQYGHINLVAPHASSTSEIIYHFHRHNRLAISPTAATALLTGIVLDTGHFTNSATTKESLAVSADLVRLGANFNLIHAQTVRNKNLQILHLWGEVFSRLREIGNGVVYTYIKNSDWTTHGVAEHEGEGLTNFLNNLDGIKIALILKEGTNGTIKGSFRTTRDDVDVSALAKKLGGGGHKKAAGFTLEGTIESTLAKVQEILQS